MDELLDEKLGQRRGSSLSFNHYDEDLTIENFSRSKRAEMNIHQRIFVPNIDPTPRLKPLKVRNKSAKRRQR